MSTEDELHAVSLYFALFAAMLALVMILSKQLRENPTLNSFISEAALILIVGMLVGLLVCVFLPESEPTSVDGEDEEFVLAHSLLSFSPNVFFMALLPPIVFNSGYQLRRELFYRHITPIVSFACLGTTISACCTGLALFGISQLGWMGSFQPTILEFFTFGALIAATDTVSILSVLQAKRVDPRTYYLVFGESALNDAVALVLFKTCSAFLLTDFDDAGSIAVKMVEFLLTLAAEAIGSPALGVIFGVSTALMFKHLDFREYAHLELPLFMLLMYVPFVVAECCSLSGVVAIFFSGISARRYVSPNVSNETRANGETIFKLTSYIAETSIFLELGLSVFGLPGSFNWAFIVWAFVASLMGRALAIYPIAFFYNHSLKEVPKPPLGNVKVNQDGLLRTENNGSNVSDSPNSQRRKTPMKRKDKQISPEIAHVLWFAGMKGAVAYACARKFPNIFGHADEFVAATMVIVLVSIVVMGGASVSFLRYLNIKMDVDEEEYMEEWRKRRSLKGPIHEFEYNWIFCSVVRDPLSIQPTLSSDSSIDSNLTFDCQADGIAEPPHVERKPIDELPQRQLD